MVAEQSYENVCVWAHAANLHLMGTEMHHYGSILCGIAKTKLGQGALELALEVVTHAYISCNVSIEQTKQ